MEHKLNEGDTILLEGAYGKKVYFKVSRWGTIVRVPPPEPDYLYPGDMTKAAEEFVGKLGVVNREFLEQELSKLKGSRADASNALLRALRTRVKPANARR